MTTHPRQGQQGPAPVRALPQTSGWRAGGWDRSWLVFPAIGIAAVLTCGLSGMLTAGLIGVLGQLFG